MRRLLWALALAAQATPSYAFECRSTDGEPSQVWVRRCLPFVVSTKTGFFSDPQRRQAVVDSFETWRDPCTDLRFVDLGNIDEGANARGLIVIEASEEPLNGVELPAQSRMVYFQETGELIEGTISLNIADFRFGDAAAPGACSPSAPFFDLRSTLVHEISAVLGLGRSPDPLSVTDVNAETCRVRREPSADDRLGICTLYPAGQPTHACVPPASYDIENQTVLGLRGVCESRIELETDSGCGCSASHRRGGTAWALLACALALLFRRR